MNGVKFKLPLVDHSEPVVHSIPITKKSACYFFHPVEPLVVSVSVENNHERGTSVNIHFRA